MTDDNSEVDIQQLYPNEVKLEIQLEDALTKAQEVTNKLQNERQVPEEILHETYTL